MPVICPKCSAVRKDTDTAPDWQCPACGVAYAKVGQRTDVPDGRVRREERVEIAHDQRFPVFKVSAAILLFVLSAGWMHWHAGQKDKEWASVTANCRQGQPEIVLFARTDCGYCKQVKAFLRAKQMCYTTKITNKDSNALAEFRRIKGKGVPLLIIGTERSDGYDQEWMEVQLQPWL